MKVKAIQTFNGLTAGGVVAFVAGQSYDIDEGSANDLQRGGYLETVSPSKVFAVEHREEIASEVIADTIPDTIIVVVEDATAKSVDFTVVKGISDEVRAALYGAGYLTWEDILQAGVVKIKDDVASVGMARARSLYAMAIREAR
jgi:hypothetical protein